MNSQNNNTTDSFSDVKKILNKVIKNWYFFVLALGIAYSAAFFHIRYTEEVYPVEAFILIKNENGAGSAAELLYGNQLFDNSRSSNTEAVLMKSYPLINKVVKSLDFDKVFYTEGNVLTKEIYQDAPAKIIYDSTSSYLPYWKEFDFIVVDEDHFSFFESEESDNKDVKKGLYPFNEEIDYKGFRFTAFKKDNINYSKIINNRYIFKILDTYGLTNSYRGKLLIMPMPEDPSLLRLAVKGTIPQKEIDFLNKLTEVYRQEEIRKKNIIASKTISFIDSQLKNITDSLNFIENKLANFRVEKRVTSDISEEGRRQWEQLERLETERAQLASELQYYDYIVSYIRTNQDGDDLVIPSSAGVTDPVLNKFIADFVNLQVQRKKILQGNQPNNPYIPQLNREIDGIKSNIVESVNNLRNSSQFKKNSFDQRIAKLEQGIRTLPGAQREFVDITRNNQLSENLYLLYTEKRAEAAISQASTTSDITIVNPPMQAGGPIEPQTKRIYFVAFFLGISIPLGFIIVTNFLNNKIQYKEDIENLTQIPLLGQIWKKGKGGNLVVNQNPKSAVAESFRSIRSNLNFFTSGKEKKIFLITSSISGEGKTFCALNLSTVFSFSGKPTLLIGADLRKPRIFNDLGLSNEVGLSSYLSNSAQLSQIIQRSEIPNLDVICSGPIPPNPSELLMDEKMTELMSELKNIYDYIVIDTAPVGLVTDAYILMEHVDHTIYMVRQNYSNQDSLKTAQELYNNGKLRKTSILFNDVKIDRNKNGYGYYVETT